MRSPWKVGLAMWCMGLMLASGGSAYVLNGHDWSYQATPMGENWIVCGTSVPGSGVQRTKDGAAGWNYSKFNFTFGADVCSSGGVYPSFNNVNQFDFGGGLGAGVLAQTTSWFFTNNPADTVECDMRFSSDFSWYTGTGIPTSTQYDWQSVAIHEMGHCLGLDHQNDITPTPVMSSTIAAGEIRRTLTSDDIAGRNAIYSAVLPELTLSLNQSTFRSGNTLRVGLRAQNPGVPINTDFYFGILLPDGVTVLFVTSLSPLNSIVTRLDADPRTFRPLLASVQLPQGLDVTLTDFLVYTFAGGEPAGAYAVFTFFTPPGAFNDGRIDAGDLLVIDVRPFGFSP